MINVEAEIQKLLKEIGPGRMSSTAYDTAWVARLGEIDTDLSNQAMEWLSENQLPDGSWGAKEIFYYHDRVICTLAAMIALTQRGRRAYDKLQIEKGLIALERITSGATQGLASDPNGATVGFEMIAPTLVAEAEKMGIIKQQGERILGRLSSMRMLKLSKLAGRKINRHVTPAFSAEMAGVDGQHMLDLDNLQEANGSIGQSPSATAYYVSFVRKGDPLGINYIKQTIGSDKGAPDLFPFDVYERAWILWNLGLSNHWSKETRLLMEPHFEHLRNSWKPGSGIGFSAEYSIPDGDDTIITYELLKKNGYKVDIESVLNFEEPEYFRCYHLEVGVSPSVNIHALMALREYGLEISHPAIQKILRFLDSQKTDKFWVDKWNSSPFYTSSHYVAACVVYKYEAAKHAVDWIIKNQHPDGSWGHFCPTAEETAYCLQALTLWNRIFGVPIGVIKKGRDWLVDHLGPPYPPIWIGKGLYSAELVARSAILSALRLVEEVL